MCKHVGLLLALCVCPLAGAVGHAQEAPPLPQAEQIEQLRQENEELRQRVERLEGQVRELLEQQTGARREPSTEDLLSPEVAGLERAPTSEQPGGGNLNPDIAVVGDFLANVGDATASYPDTRSVNREVEFTYTQRLAPWARVWATAALHGAAHADGGHVHEAGVRQDDHKPLCERPSEESHFHIEEAFIDFDRCVDSFDFRVGRLRLKSSLYNFAHTHELPFVDRPLPIRHFLGEEGLFADGGWVTFAPPNALNLGVTGGVFDNRSGALAFGAPGDDRLWWGNLHGESDWHDGKSQFYWNANYWHAPRCSADFGVRPTDLYGGELAYRYQKDQYRRFELRGEYLTASLGTGPRRYDRDGWYVNALFRWPDEYNRKREAGMLFERTQHPDFDIRGDVGALSAYYTWDKTERIRFRTQYTHLFGDVPTSDTDDILFFQLDWILGFHPPHD